MNKVVISGYYGFNNMGDESILTAIILDLRGHIPDIDITVLSENPEITSKKHNVKSVYSKSLIDIVRVIKGTDLLISGGGSLLQDVTSKKNVIYYLSIMYIAKALKKKVMIYSQGMGPIRSNFNRKLTRLMLEKVDAITLRDSRSERFLKEIHLRNPNLYVTADPVIGLEQNDLELGRTILLSEGVEDEDLPIVGFAIRGRSKDSKFISDLCRLSDRLIGEHGIRVVFIPFHHGEDIHILDHIERDSKEEVICLHDQYTILELLSIVGNTDLMVGERLHSLIFSAVMKVPMIALSYDPKINNFMGYLSEKVFSDIDEIDFDELYEEILEKLSFEDKNKNKLSEKINRLKDKLSKNTIEIKKLLK